jgi:uncharacterized protein (TIGR03435 family)
MSKTTRVIVMLCLTTCLRAQTFDAVSIRPNTSGAAQRSFRANPGQVVATNVTVRQMIWNAYNIPDFLVVGGPDWLDSDRYDMTAKSESATTPDLLRLSLRNTLAERFGLRARLVAQEQPMYALVVARPGASGPALRRVEGPCDPAQPLRVCGFNFNGSRLASNAASMPRLAQELRGLVERHVVDRTGLEGLYEITLQWSPDQQANGPSLFTALQEQLGLKLEPQRGPVEVLVIDSVERPTEN